MNEQTTQDRAALVIEEAMTGCFWPADPRPGCVHVAYADAILEALDAAGLAIVDKPRRHPLRDTVTRDDAERWAAEVAE